jgi:fumarate hydratase subunit beta
VSATRLRAPLDDAAILALRTGDAVEIDGVIYGARDAAHARLDAALAAGEPLPFELAGQIIYYVGPAPARPGEPIGSAGPTTSSRMDRYAPALYAAGLRATIGKGYRSLAVREAIARHTGVYLAALGGSGALLSRRIRAAQVVAYPDLGPEAIYRLEVERFPVVVVNDAHGSDLYAQAREEWRTDPGDG